MTKEELIALLTRYEAGTCDEREQKLIEQWFAQRVDQSDWQWQDDDERSRVENLMRARVTAQLFSGKKQRVISWKRMAVAAIVVCCCSVAAWFYLNSQAPDALEQFYTKHAVAPGSSAALLTLADGKTIRLDEIQSGTLYDDRRLAIRKTENDELTYVVIGADMPDNDPDAGMNQLSIPRGGQYQLTLPDGTKVWLNSASTLRYPTIFSGDERTVTLSGEAYFEVAKDENRPFKVMADETEILVKGTHFNVTAYPDEHRVVTTLVEGAVQINKQNQTTLLAPGQQAITTTATAHIQKSEVDTDFALAWVRGDFLFEDQDIYLIMKNIARWYNVEVSFEGKIPEKTYGGSYTKSKGLYELLHHLTTISNLDIQAIDERRVKVMP